MSYFRAYGLGSNFYKAYEYATFTTSNESLVDLLEKTKPVHVKCPEHLYSWELENMIWVASMCQNLTRNKTQYEEKCIKTIKEYFLDKNPRFFNYFENKNKCIAIKLSKSEVLEWKQKNNMIKSGNVYRFIGCGEYQIDDSQDSDYEEN